MRQIQGMILETRSGGYVWQLRQYHPANPLAFFEIRQYNLTFLGGDSEGFRGAYILTSDPTEKKWQLPKWLVIE